MRRFNFGFIKKRHWALALSITILGVLGVFGTNATLESSAQKQNGIDWVDGNASPLTERDHRRLVEHYLAPSLQKNNYLSSFDFSFLGNSEKVRVLYTFDFELQKELTTLLHQYASDYSAVVAMDPATGKILAMASYEEGEPSKENWALKATFPAASIFKIITASAAIEKYNVPPDMEIGYTGGNYKLYKRDLFNENQKWARSITFREAFAKSINIFFGKLALKVMQSGDLMTYAQKFYFNKDLQGDLPAESGKVSVTSDEPYHIAEVASGYNSLNTLSPVHGALIASAVINNGVMFSPYVVESILRPNGTSVYKSVPFALDKPITVSTSEKLRDLMKETIESGTSRKSFREISHAKQFSLLEAGGKTGSLNGLNPKGKTDWFVGYGRMGNRMLALSVVTVNKDFWKVKSSYLAQRLIKQYFKEDVYFTTAKGIETVSSQYLGK